MQNRDIWDICVWGKQTLIFWKPIDQFGLKTGKVSQKDGKLMKYNITKILYTEEQSQLLSVVT